MEKGYFENIENSWLLLFDGLTIQRYFLHVFPWLESLYPITHNTYKELLEKITWKSYEEKYFYLGKEHVKILQVGTKNIYYHNHSTEKLVEAIYIIQNANLLWVVELGGSFIINEDLRWVVCWGLDHEFFES